jgi:hypothetical protein
MEQNSGGTKITCPQCGAENSLLAVTCQNCGSLLVEAKTEDSFRKTPAVNSPGVQPEISKPLPPPVPQGNESPTINGQSYSTAASAASAAPSTQVPTSAPAVGPTIICPRCSKVNPDWRSICENCGFDLRAPAYVPSQADQRNLPQSFGASFGVGCLTMLLANIANNLFTLLVAAIAPSVFGSSGGTIACTIISLFVFVIIGFSIANGAVKKRRSGMNGGGVALAIVIAIIIIAIATASGTNALNLLH